MNTIKTNRLWGDEFQPAYFNPQPIANDDPSRHEPKKQPNLTVLTRLPIPSFGPNPSRLARPIGKISASDD